jgi:two-component system, NarL family, invasion response regulator UvrY
VTATTRCAPVSVLVVDDQLVFRRVAREVIEATEDFIWVGEADSGERALELAPRLHPDLVILDVRMPGIGGLGAARGLRTTEPGAVVVLISIDDEADLPGDTPTCGAAAVVRKQDFGSGLLRRLWAAHGPPSSD